jgi:hypothetical protein
LLFLGFLLVHSVNAYGSAENKKTDEATKEDPMTIGAKEPFEPLK